MITETIANEYGDNLPHFIKLQEPKDKNYQRILSSFLDPGEASAIALAIENEGSLLILDDQKARRKANQLQLNITGTIGILILALEKGYLNSSTDLIARIKETDFYISDFYLEEIARKSKQK